MWYPVEGIALEISQVQDKKCNSFVLRKPSADYVAKGLSQNANGKNL